MWNVRNAAMHSRPAVWRVAPTHHESPKRAMHAHHPAETSLTVSRTSTRIATPGLVDNWCATKDNAALRTQRVSRQHAERPLYALRCTNVTAASKLPEKLALLPRHATHDTTPTISMVSVL